MNSDNFEFFVTRSISVLSSCLLKQCAFLLPFPITELLQDMRPGDSANYKRNWAAMSDEFKSDQSQEFQYLKKRSKASPLTCYSNFTINIDDLPDPLLFEILLRLPVKSVARYKCVSRRWFALISHHTFLSRFLCLQHDKRKPFPMEPTLIISDDEKGFIATSELPIFESGSFSLDFLPGYQSARTKKIELDAQVVVASCNDLVLWCASKTLQRDYYICNPYTKQWTAIPPSPQCSYEVRVGFICEPYYYYKEDVDRQSTCSSSSTVQLNVDYKYAIVRILSPLHVTERRHIWINSKELKVEIFSSETGKWTELVVSCPPHLCYEGLCYEYPGLAYKGKLYWVHGFHNDFMIALDPFSDNINHFDVVHLPYWGRISVTQEGRLRLYNTSLLGDRTIPGDKHLKKGLRIWELKDDDDKVDGRAAEWCKIDTLLVENMVSENPVITEWSRTSEVAPGIGFDPSNDDILYLRSVVNDVPVMIMCNIRENTLKEVTTVNGKVDSVFRFMVPWWPTPVPKIEYNHQETHATHLNNCHLCSKYTQPQLLKELENRLIRMYWAYPPPYVYVGLPLN